MKILVGYTGFVGSNIYKKGSFDAAFNSKNIKDAYGTNPELLIYSGLRAEKYLANTNPEKDMDLVLEAEQNIKKINPKKLVLISTVDVFKIPKDVDENSIIDTENLHPYGYNRYILECWVRENYPDALIIRLPGLFGENIKKNFIYDCINIIPFMIKEDKMNELSSRIPEIKAYYELQDNGFYKVQELSDFKKDYLKSCFNKLGFSALNFTDSRSRFQFYPLARLWDDIQIALDNNITLWHPATQPVSAEEVYLYLTGKMFKNEIMSQPFDYDYKTIYSELFGGDAGYVLSKENVLQMIKNFVQTF